MADNAGPSRPRPRAGLGAFSGGPLGIGWAPWAIGAAALLGGILFFLSRRGGGAAQQAGGAIPVTSQPQPVNVFPFPPGDGAAGPNPSAAQLLTIRDSLANTQSPASSWDVQHTGIPVRARPCGELTDPKCGPVGQIPFGGTVQARGAPVPGENNFGRGTAPVGSSYWWPVNFGGAPAYVSAFDVLASGSNISAQQLGTPTGSSLQPLSTG